MCLYRNLVFGGRCDQDDIKGQLIPKMNDVPKEVEPSDSRSEICTYSYPCPLVAFYIYGFQGGVIKVVSGLMQRDEIISGSRVNDRT